MATKVAEADSVAKKMEESHTTATTDKPIGDINRDSSCDSTSRPTAQTPRWEILPFMDTSCAQCAQIHSKAGFCYKFQYQYSLISGQCQHYVKKQDKTATPLGGRVAVFWCYLAISSRAFLKVSFK